jgi:hypothetical protein
LFLKKVRMTDVSEWVEEGEQKTSELRRVRFYLENEK